MIVILEGTEVRVFISAWIIRLGLNQEGIMTDWSMFAKLLKWGRVSQAEGAV